jgi:hypothetical protein
MLVTLIHGWPRRVAARGRHADERLDVSGIEVGFKTLISGDGPLVRGKGPVRTGVTATTVTAKWPRARITPSNNRLQRTALRIR